MLNISKSDENGRTVITLEGRLDVNAAKEADKQFMDTAEEADDIILDCAKLEYIASAGLRAIKRLRQAMKEKDSKLAVRNVNKDIMDVFSVTGFTALLKFE